MFFIYLYMKLLDKNYSDIKKWIVTQNSDYSQRDITLRGRDRFLIAFWFIY